MSSTTFDAPGGVPSGFFDRAHIIARPGFNRWLVPPAALAIHLCIGMIYGFSVFWLPLTRTLGGAKSIACPDLTLLSALTTTSCDWRLTDVTHTFELAIVILGASAALFGGWLERAGPRKSGLVSAACWCGGLTISAAGVHWHQLWLVWLGAGVVGGIGLGIGYITPVSTLIKWFPDRRGMATGMAIMGFGGGAMIGAPLAVRLMAYFAVPGDNGVASTFLAFAAIYAVFMVGGALAFRVAAAGWKPAGYVQPAAKAGMITQMQVHLRDAHKTPQFWLIWVVLCMNVSAGIGVLSVASPMLQRIFGGDLIGAPGTAFADLTPAQVAGVVAVAAGFTGLLSLFNIGGRFFWASISDTLGRKATFAIFFGLGILLYAAMPTLANTGERALFVLVACIALSMYGGGFATVPAYLADMFGTQFVGAIHGRLLTAWSTAGVLGPVLLAAISDARIKQGVPAGAAYGGALYVMAGLLMVGFVANLLVRPVSARYAMSDAQIAQARALAGETATAPADTAAAPGLSAVAVLAWAAVGLPILWGVYVTVQKALALFA